MSLTEQPSEFSSQRDSVPDPSRGDASRSDLLVVAGRNRAALLKAMRLELRMPANTLIGMCWLLQRSVLSPVQQGYVSELYAASRHLLDIVDQLLDGSMPDDQAQGEQIREFVTAGHGRYHHLAPSPSWGPGPAVSALDEASWRHVRARLVRLLDEADTDCIRLAHEHASQLSSHLGADYPAWTTALRRFDFELALQLLRAAGM